MSSSSLPVRNYQPPSSHSLRFCEACLNFDDELTRIESLLEKPEPLFKGIGDEGPTHQLNSQPSFEISVKHIWDSTLLCRCCTGLSTYVSRRLSRIIFARLGDGEPLDLSGLSLSVVWLPLFPELTVPRLSLKVRGSIIIKETEVEVAPDVTEYYTTTPSSRDGLLLHTVGSWIDFAQIRQWIRECRASHGTECSRSQLPQDWSMISLDTRDLTFYLIDVFRMCLTVSKMDDAPPYVALSYRWGDPKCSTQCRLDNLAIMTAPGGLMSEDVILAGTIKDAITLTREVGFRYLWVDALCIIQDDYERKPMYLNLMGTVYAEAAFVLAILEGHAENGITGIGRSRDTSDSIYLPTRILMKSTHRIAGNEKFSDKTWATRGWTFQEGLFASKMLSIDKFASWHCPCAHWMEEGRRLSEARHNKASSEMPAQAENKQNMPSTFLDLPRVPTHMSLAGYARLIQSYNTRSLTMDSDALNAVAGVTGRLLTLFPDGFLQGTPQLFFDVALLWQPRSPVRRRTYTPNAAALSSWSWAAWHGELDLSAWSDSHLVYDEPLVVRNNRVVNWHKLRFTKTADGETKEEWQPIQYTFHVSRNRFEDPTVTEVPCAWHAHVDKNEDGTTAGRYFTYDPDDRENHMSGIKFRFPFPPFERLRNVDREPAYSHLLKGKVQTASFSLDMSALSDSTSECVRAVEDAHLVDESGDRVGWLRLNLYDELRPDHGTECELVAISESVVDFRLGSIDSTTWSVISAFSNDARVECFLNVLWIEWKGDVAYRRALGQVVRKAWESRKAGEIEILLG